jgi:hypothetical protein
LSSNLCTNEPPMRKAINVCRGSCVLTLPRFQRTWIDVQMRLKLPGLRYRTLGLFIARKASKKKIFPDPPLGNQPFARDQAPGFTGDPPRIL